MKKYSFFVMAILLSFDYSFAQNASHISLRVGDTVPNLHFREVVNYSKGALHLSELKGKLVILDFWATWYTSFVNHFSALQDYQDKFRPNLQILLINAGATGDVKEKVVALIKKQNAVIPGGFSLPSAVHDSIADKLFPHHLLPHYLWISPTGIVQAITGSAEVNAKNIQMALARKNELLDCGRLTFGMTSISTCISAVSINSMQSAFMAALKK